ncbi:MAG: GNAT family N-acetyltransferase [Reichenbachiella sp.]
MITPQHLTALSAEQKKDVFKLWNKEYPTSLTFKDIREMEEFINSLEQLKYIVLLEEKGSIMAWMGMFTRDGDRWFSILVDSKYQGKGYGSVLLEEAKKNEQSLSGWVMDHNKDKKVNGDHYYSPLSFYLKNGFDMIPDIRYEQNNVSALKINWEKD